MTGNSWKYQQDAVLYEYERTLLAGANSQFIREAFPELREHFDRIDAEQSLEKKEQSLENNKKERRVSE